MTSTRPYLIRAIYEWIVDNGQTPHLLVEAADTSVQVPRQYIEDGMIVLNVAPSAVRDLDLGNEFILFSARFSGTPYDISVPVDAVKAIYARENGQGIFLGEPDEESGQTTTVGEVEGNESSAHGKDKTQQIPKRGAPHLTIVK